MKRRRTNTPKEQKKAKDVTLKEMLKALDRVSAKKREVRKRNLE